MKEDLLTFIAKQFYEEKDLTYYTGLIDTFNSNKDDLIYSHKYDEKELKKLSGCKYSFGIGDFYNDAELISLADYGAAVLAAPDEIKELAEKVAGLKEVEKLKVKK